MLFYISVISYIKNCFDLIPVNKYVAIALWFLATPEEYRTIAHLFGVARCTVRVIVNEVCNARVSKW